MGRHRAVGLPQRALLLLVLTAGCGSDPDAPRPAPDPPAVRVTPTRPAPDQPIRVTFPSPYVLGGETRNGRRTRRGRYSRRVLGSDNYHVIFVGPGGRKCDSRLRYASGYAIPRRRTPRRTVTIEPHRLPFGRVRRGRTWCPGRYTGRVEVRQPERFPAIPFEQLGRFTFEVGN